MKIAINARLLLPQLEGIGQYTYQLIDQLSDQHPEVEWHVLQDRRHDVALLKRENVHRHIVHPQTRHPILWRYWFDFAVPRKLKNIGADLFFSPDGYGSTRVTIPQVMTIHDLAYLEWQEGIPASHSKYLHQYMGRWIDKSNQIIAVSNFTKKSIHQHFDIDDENVVAIPNGVAPTFQPITEAQKLEIRKRYTSGRPYFLYVGALHPRKNIVRLIEAFESFKSETDTDHCLVIAGRLAWGSNEIRSKLQDSAIRSDIVHLGHLSNIEEIIASADLMCYVSLFEGFGLPVLEAMKCGVPVLTSQKSAMSEVAGDAAIKVDPTDVSAIAHGMKKFIKSDPAPMIKQGLTRASEFSWAETARRTFAVLEKAV